ncbi:hypothetical protein Tcan_18075 [Toxocara canis]|nr:hypothetical protein Tcan_18075 [Toxocara canis]
MHKSKTISSHRQLQKINETNVTIENNEISELTEIISSDTSRVSVNALDTTSPSKPIISNDSTLQTTEIR